MKNVIICICFAVALSSFISCKMGLGEGTEPLNPETTSTSSTTSTGTTPSAPGTNPANPTNPAGTTDPANNSPVTYPFRNLTLTDEDTSLKITWNNPTDNNIDGLEIYSTALDYPYENDYTYNSTTKVTLTKEEVLTQEYSIAYGTKSISRNKKIFIKAIPFTLDTNGEKIYSDYLETNLIVNYFPLVKNIQFTPQADGQSYLLTFTPPEGSYDKLGYIVSENSDYANTPMYSFAKTITQAIITPTATNYFVKPLIPGKKYYITVRALKNNSTTGPTSNENFNGTNNFVTYVLPPVEPDAQDINCVTTGGNIYTATYTITQHYDSTYDRVTRYYNKMEIILEDKANPNSTPIVVSQDYDASVVWEEIEVANWVPTYNNIVLEVPNLIAGKTYSVKLRAYGDSADNMSINYIDMLLDDLTK